MSNKLEDSSEVLFRQIHPNFMEGGEPASDRFRPSERDKNMLSVDRSSRTTAAQSHALYTGNGLASAAVYGLSVGEFGAEAIECIEDPIEASEGAAANYAHALANYSPHTLKDQKLKAKRLKRVAVARGRLHPPPEPV